MFRWINKRCVESVEGYIFQYDPLYYFDYSEGGHILKIDTEPGLKIFSLYFKSNPAWEAPHECEEISVEKRNQIEMRIQQALKFMKIRFKINKGEH